MQDSNRTNTRSNQPGYNYGCPYYLNYGIIPFISQYGYPFKPRYNYDTVNMMCNNDGNLREAIKSDVQKEVLIVDKLKCVKDSLQAIVVTNDNYDKITATLETFEKTGSSWKRAFPPMKAVLGNTGFTYNKVEGDGGSPIGVYTFGTCFGKYPNPGTMLPYRQTTENDTWVDDVDSPYYNTWQVNPSYERWNSGEVLRPEDGVYYDYAVVINYNTVDRIPGRGSAIFMHIWEGPEVPTFGCTAVEYDNLLKIIKWLNPCKNPIIIQGPVNEVLKW